MIHLAVNLLVFIVVSIMAFCLFFAYVVGLVFRGIWNLLSRITGVVPPYRPLAMYGKRCSRFRCGARNPPEANYCRRCGSPLGRTVPRSQADVAAGRKWVSSSVSL